MTKDDVKESVESITEDVCEKARNGKIKRGENRARDCDELDDDQVTKYRALVARANIETRLGKAPEIGKVLETQASVRTMVCISRHDKRGHLLH